MNLLTAATLLVFATASRELSAAPTKPVTKTPLPISKTEQGARLLENHHVHEAIQLFEEALAENPNNCEALQGLAWGHLEEEKIDLAISELNRVIGMKRDFSMAYVTRSEAYYENNQIDLAIKDCTTVIGFAKSTAQLHEAYHLRGRIYRSLKQYAKAKADFDAAIKITPDDAGLYWNRGNVFMDSGQYEKAVSDYNQAIHFTKSSDEDRLARYYSSRAEAYEKSGQKKLAADDRKRINYKVDAEVHELFDH